ncbi:hypothetical protein [Erwinia phage Kuerle]|nr:hypothetical protein [Erwinia phage Kuerle]
MKVHKLPEPLMHLILMSAGKVLSESADMNHMLDKADQLMNHEFRDFAQVDDYRGIAFLCHEVNRAYCEALGDTSQPKWDDAPLWQVQSALKGVELHMSGDFPPSASHESWMKEKLDTGWVYGEVKDPEAKTHPCLVPFDQLPPEQKVKDFLFRAVVHAFK